MKNLYTVLTALVLTASTLVAQAAPAPAPTQCTTLRKAAALVTVRKVYWEQESGIWVQKTETLASTNNEVPVYQESSAGCTVPKVLELDNVSLNGVSQSLRVYGYIAIQDSALHKIANKLFTASYWVSTENGHSAYAQAFTPDLKANAMGVALNKERASVSPTAHEDTITVAVYFTDLAN